MSIEPRPPGNTGGSNPDAVEREWQNQERALREERQGLAPAQDAPRVKSYRVIARALAQPLHEQLPADFAQRTAHRIERHAGDRVALDARFERNLTSLLVVVFGLAAAIVAVIYGREWLQTLAAGLSGTWLTNRWLLALAACIGLSAVLGRWQPGHRAHHG
jgi:hypothetical protein